MESLKWLTFGIFAIIEERCKIGNEGLKHLAKANWPNLSHLIIDLTNIHTSDKNYIGLDGVVGLRLSSWSQLKKL